MTAQELPDHISYSQISKYLTCPLRYRFQYVDCIPPAFTSAGLAFGSAIHEAVAAFYQEHLIGEALRVDQMVDVYRQSWADREAENIKFFNGDSHESLLNTAKQLLEVFNESFSEETKVLGVEEFFEVQLPGTPPLQGFIDLIESSARGDITVADLKTAARKPSGKQAHSNLQLTAYSLGAEALGFEPQDLTLRLDVLLKQKSPSLVRQETTRTQEERERFIRLAQSVWNAIEREAFYPRADWHCVQCPYHDTCQNW